MARKTIVPRSKPTGRQLPPFVIDLGNGFVKYTIDNVEGNFVHKLAEVTPTQFEAGLERFGKTAPMDYVAMNTPSGEKYYVIGETADSYRVQARKGRPKYERDYYGPLFANSVARVFLNDPSFLADGLRVMASHASNDFQFRKQLNASVKGRWKFNCNGVDFNFEVVSVETYEEPFGGYARQAFRLNRRGEWESPLHGRAVGIIDIGYGTCGSLAVDEGGTVQYAAAFSGQHGIGTAVQTLKEELEGNHTTFFSRGVPSEKRLGEALRTGIYAGGGQELECHEEVQMALNPLLNEVNTMFTTHLEAGVNLDIIVLTGGGNALLHDYVKEIIGWDQNILLADSIHDLQYANVRGARDFAAVLESVE